jgi:hypothetical protein
LLLISATSEVTISAAVSIALAVLQLAFVAVGMELAKAFFVCLSAILTVTDDIILTPLVVYSAETIHNSPIL